MTPAIRLEGVFLRYRVPNDRIGSLKEYAIRRLKGNVTFEEREALHDISLEVAPGENLGVIGHNGAGKTTMCRVIARVIPPTEGRVVVRGRVAPLLEIGLGLQGELTGRENAYLQGALLGFSRREMKRRLPGIVEFAELADYIDAPVRTYSSGMAARLAFAVATDVVPDVLLVDETLAVGDARFQEKCRQRMAGFRRDGKTILLVSHSMEQIRANCLRVVWLHHGRIRADGPASDVIREYQEWSLGTAAAPAAR